MIEPILKAINISKSFYGVSVLDQVNFEVCPGEIMGLVGENGAGKSTLMKIITGLYTKDSGQIILNGKEVNFTDPGKSRDAGISIIHQEFNIFSNLSIAENIFLDRVEYRNKFGQINWDRMRKDAAVVMSDLGEEIDVNMPVRLLSVREQQLVEISKAISSEAKIIIMDEPSGALPENEVEKMFEVIRTLKKKGVAIVYISHRMKEIGEICDRVTVLRDGRNAGIVKMTESRINDVISMMIGREIKDYYPHTKRTPGEIVLKVNGLSGYGLRDVSFNVRKNEVVGIYGLAGSGSTELAEMIMGLRNVPSGTISLNGKEIQSLSVSQAMNAGLGYVPPNRRQEGIITDMSVKENTILANLSAYTRNLLMDNIKIRERVKYHIEAFRIKCSSQDELVQHLSGGNQQKVVLAKWMDRNPGMLILNEPTRGVDVGAKSEIYKLINELSNNGLPILFISSEVPEVLGVCDRIITMYRGRIAVEYENENIEQDQLLLAASGAS